MDLQNPTPDTDVDVALALARARAKAAQAAPTQTPAPSRGRGAGPGSGTPFSTTAVPPPPKSDSGRSFKGAAADAALSMGVPMALSAATKLGGPWLTAAGVVGGGLGNLADQYINREDIRDRLALFPPNDPNTPKDYYAPGEPTSVPDYDWGRAAVGAAQGLIPGFKYTKGAGRLMRVIQAAPQAAALGALRAGVDDVVQTAEGHQQGDLGRTARTMLVGAEGGLPFGILGLLPHSPAVKPGEVPPAGGVPPPPAPSPLGQTRAQASQGLTPIDNLVRATTPKAPLPPSVLQVLKNSIKSGDLSELLGNPTITAELGINDPMGLLQTKDKKDLLLALQSLTPTTERGKNIMAHLLENVKQGVAATTPKPVKAPKAPKAAAGVPPPPQAGTVPQSPDTVTFSAPLTPTVDPATLATPAVPEAPTAIPPAPKSAPRPDGLVGIENPPPMEGTSVSAPSATTEPVTPPLPAVHSVYEPGTKYYDPVTGKDLDWRDAKQRLAQGWTSQADASDPDKVTRLIHPPEGVVHPAKTGGAVQDPAEAFAKTQQGSAAEPPAVQPLEPEDPSIAAGLRSRALNLDPTVTDNMEVAEGVTEAAALRHVLAIQSPKGTTILRTFPTAEAAKAEQTRLQGLGKAKRVLAMTDVPPTATDEQIAQRFADTLKTDRRTLQWKKAPESQRSIESFKAAIAEARDQLDQLTSKPRRGMGPKVDNLRAKIAQLEAGMAKAKASGAPSGTGRAKGEPKGSPKGVIVERQTPPTLTQREQDRLFEAAVDPRTHTVIAPALKQQMRSRGWTPVEITLGKGKKVVEMRPPSDDVLDTKTQDIIEALGAMGPIDKNKNPEGWQKAAEFRQRLVELDRERALNSTLRQQAEARAKAGGEKPKPVDTAKLDALRNRYREVQAKLVAAKRTRAGLPQPKDQASRIDTSDTELSQHILDLRAELVSIQREADNLVGGHTPVAANAEVVNPSTHLPTRDAPPVSRTSMQEAGIQEGGVPQSGKVKLKGISDAGDDFVVLHPDRAESEALPDDEEIQWREPTGTKPVSPPKPPRLVKPNPPAAAAGVSMEPSAGEAPKVPPPPKSVTVDELLAAHKLRAKEATPPEPAVDDLRTKPTDRFKKLTTPQLQSRLDALRAKEAKEGPIANKNPNTAAARAKRAVEMKDLQGEIDARRNAQERTGDAAERGPVTPQPPPGNPLENVPTAQLQARARKVANLREKQQTEGLTPAEAKILDDGTAAAREILRRNKANSPKGVKGPVPPRAAPEPEAPRPETQASLDKLDEEIKAATKARDLRKASALMEERQRISKALRGNDDDSPTGVGKTVTFAENSRGEGIKHQIGEVVEVKPNGDVVVQKDDGTRVTRPEGTIFPADRPNTTEQATKSSTDIPEPPPPSGGGGKPSTPRLRELERKLAAAKTAEARVALRREIKIEQNRISKEGGSVDPRMFQPWKWGEVKREAAARAAAEEPVGPDGYDSPEQLKQLAAAQKKAREVEATGVEPEGTGVRGWLTRVATAAMNTDHELNQVQDALRAAGDKKAMIGARTEAFKGGQGGHARANIINFEQAYKDVHKAGLTQPLLDLSNLLAMKGKVNRTLSRGADALAEALNGAGEVKSAELWRALKRSSSQWRKLQSGEGLPVGYTPSAVDRDIANIRGKLTDKQWETTLQPIKMLDDAANELLDAAVAEGQLTPKLRDQYKADGPYLALERMRSRFAPDVQERLDQAAGYYNGGSLSGEAQRLNAEFKGSGEINADPIVGTLRKLQLAWNEVGRSKVIREGVDELMRDTSPFKALVKRLKPGERPMPGTAAVKFYDPAFPGKIQRAQVPGFIAAPWTMGDRSSAALQTGLFSAWNNLGRLTQANLVSLRNPGFFTVNPIKDFMGARRMSGAFNQWNPIDTVKSVAEWGKALVDVAKRHPDYIASLKNQEQFSGWMQTGLEKELIDNVYTRLHQELNGDVGFFNHFPKAVGIGLKRLPENAAELGTIFEAATKLMTSRRLQQRFPNMTALERANRVRNFGGSPDFAVHGTLAPQLKTIGMLMNSGIQGNRQIVSWANANKLAAAGLIAQQIVGQAALNAWNNQFKDDQGNPAINHVPAYLREANNVMMLPSYVDTPTGKKHVFLMFPRGYPQRLAATFVNDVSDIVQGKKHVNDLAADMAENFLPLQGELDFNSAASALKSTGLAMVASAHPGLRLTAEMLMNERSFSGMPIMPERLKDLSSDEQYNAYTSPTITAAMQAAPKLGVSPIYLEYLLRGVAPGTADMVLSSLDGLVRAGSHYTDPDDNAVSRLHRAPIIGSIARRFIGPGPVDAELSELRSRFYDTANAIQSNNKTLKVKTLRNDDPEEFYQSAGAEQLLGKAKAGVFAAQGKKLAALYQARERTLFTLMKTPQQGKELEATRETLANIAQSELAILRTMNTLVPKQFRHEYLPGDNPSAIPPPPPVSK